MSQAHATGGLASLPGKIVRRIKHHCYQFEDRWFERRHGLSLNQTVALERLRIEHEESLAHAKAYQAIPCWVLRHLLLEVNRTGRRFDTFVDIGSGKGKPCFYAHQYSQSKAPKHGGFKDIVGVEFAPELVAVAQANQRKLGADRIQFVQADAAQYRLPESSCVVFLYNPFDEITLEAFARNNLVHFKAHRSVIAYANDYHRAALAALGFSVIYRNQVSRLSLHELAGLA